MTLIESISLWQQDALKIDPPPERLHAVGGLSGPAFFPEGFGLSHRILSHIKPTIMAIGHNFGCVEYREKIGSKGREDDEATWHNLDRLLIEAGASPENCFRTNWFIGLLPGDTQIGKFLRKPDEKYEQACRSLLIKQIQVLCPTVILFLGPEVAGRAYQIIPSLTPWREAKRWTDIDRSTVGPSARNIEVPEASLRTNVAALLHPSFGFANQSRRMKNMLQPTTEVDIIRAALS